ncbi:MAG TPA: hypothetical protein EYG21_09185, partial [Nitrospinaceae bacterium]|nr:hypothetical protein [Nitrospinaceae bacterium]
LKSFFGDTNPDLEHFIQLPIGYALGDEPSHDGGYDYFLDFGTHLGEGMEKIRGLEHFKDDIEIHGFEANPHVFQKIEFQPNVNYYNIAVTESNGFFQVNYELDNDGGATMIDLNNWNPEEVYQWKKDERFQKYGHSLTPSLSISNILEWLIPEKKEKSILAKFDIEGCEYAVFEELRKTDNFKWFSKIYVEFHLPFFKDVAPHTSDFEWLSYFESIGLATVLWD